MGLVWLLIVVVLVMPSFLWSPIVERSARRLNDISLMRQLKLPRMLLPLILINAIVMAMFFWSLLSEAAGNNVMVQYVYVALSLVAVVYGLAMLLWSRLLQDTWFVVRKSCKRACLAPQRSLTLPTYALMTSSRHRNTARNQVKPILTDLKKALPLSKPSNSRDEPASPSHGLTPSKQHENTPVHQKQLVAIYC
eukprot:scaffold182370_cov28-Prasinocladus_malaysianus.AAC.1